MLQVAHGPARMLVIAQHYLGTLALEEEECGQWAACSEPHVQVLEASWASPAQGGDGLDPSSTWHGADAVGAQWHRSVLRPSPCNLPPEIKPCLILRSVAGMCKS